MHSEGDVFCATNYVELFYHLLKFLHFDLMIAALIEFANKATDSTRISSKEPIRKLNNLSFVHCPTLSLPLCKSGRYTNLISKSKRSASFPYWDKIQTMLTMFSLVTQPSTNGPRPCQWSAALTHRKRWRVSVRTVASIRNCSNRKTTCARMPLCSRCSPSWTKCWPRIGPHISVGWLSKHTRWFRWRSAVAFLNGAPIRCRSPSTWRVSRAGQGNLANWARTSDTTRTIWSRRNVARLLQ